MLFYIFTIIKATKVKADDVPAGQLWETGKIFIGCVIINP